MNRRAFAASLGFLAAPRRAGPPARRSLRLVERWSWVMGQSVHLRLYAASDDEGLEAAAAALAELRRVESRLSRFDDASDLAELNRMAGRRAAVIGPDLHAVLTAAERIRVRTGGAFNPAVEPLLRAWGLHAPREAPPAPAELAAACRAVRAARIQLAPRRAWLPGSDTRLDLGGIGVGYGLDCAARVLRSRGIQHALIEVSGDVLAIGTPPGDSGWAIGIASPSERGAVRHVVRLVDAALATSSNLESVVRLGATIVGHIVSPATGEPAPRTRQVTVVAGSGIEADAFATAALLTLNAPGRVRLWVDYLSPP